MSINIPIIHNLCLLFLYWSIFCWFVIIHFILLFSCKKWNIVTWICTYYMRAHDDKNKLKMFYSFSAFQLKLTNQVDLCQQFCPTNKTSEHFVLFSTFVFNQSESVVSEQSRKAEKCFSACFYDHIHDIYHPTYEWRIAMLLHIHAWD